MGKITQGEIETLKSLKSFPYLQRIIEHVRQNDISIIDLPTGYGKTRGVPPALAFSGMRVMIAIPKIFSAVKNYNDLKSAFPSLKMNKRLGGEGDYELTDNIVFVTYGHLKYKLTKMLRQGKCKEMNFTDVLIMDEAHTPENDVLLCMAIWKYCYMAGVKFGKLILMSATIKDFAFFPTAVTFTVSAGSTRPILESYHNKIMPYSTPEERSELNIIMCEIALKYINSSIPGDVLIFVSGLSDILEIENYLANYDNIEVYHVISSDKKEGAHVEKITASLPHPNGKKYVIIATESAEESITFNSLDVVIDSLLHKRTVTDDFGFEKLEYERISVASANQRRGRAGRLRDGYCYRMTTLEDYKNFPYSRSHDLFTVSIDNLNLAIYNMGVDPLYLLADQPNINTITDKFSISTSRLINLHLLKNTSDGYITTKAGKYIADRSYDYRRGYFLYLWNIYDSKSIMVGQIIYKLLSLITDGSTPVFIDPPRKPEMSPIEYAGLKNKVHREKRGKFFGDDDLHGYINLWNFYVISGRGALEKNLISPVGFDDIYGSVSSMFPGTKSFTFDPKSFMPLIRTFIMMAYINFASVRTTTLVKGKTIYSIIDGDKKFMLDPNSMHHSSIEPHAVIPLAIQNKMKGDVCTMMVTINKDNLEFFLNPRNHDVLKDMEYQPSEQGVKKKLEFMLASYNKPVDEDQIKGARPVELSNAPPPGFMRKPDDEIQQCDFRKKGYLDMILQEVKNSFSK